MASDAVGTQLGFSWLNLRLHPQFSRTNGRTLLFICLTGIPFLVIINFIQPYILTAILGIPQEQHGSISGNLALFHELIILLLVSPFGALSDRIGRRRILVAGYIVTGVGLLIYPFATTALGLTLIRVVYAVGASGIIAVYSVILADYPQEKSRGKLVAISGMLNGLGILGLTWLGGNLPEWLTEAGYGPVAAGRLAMAIVAIACAASGIIVALGLRGGDGGGNPEQRIPLRQLVRDGFGAARNPRIAVAYAAAFAARGDVVVIGTYVSLWISQVGSNSGMNDAAALQKATIVFATIQTAALLASPVVGILNDRVNRVTALVIGMSLAAIGYLVFGFQENPAGGSWVLVAVLLGVGQISAILAGTTLIGQEADPKITGATIGVWSFCGAIGTMLGSWLGGQLFDFWMPGAPFVLMGVLNLVVAIAALFVRLRYPQATPLRIG